LVAIQKEACLFSHPATKTSGRGTRDSQCPKMGQIAEITNTYEHL